MPINVLMIEALQRYHFYYGDGFTIECPTGSGQFLTLHQVAQVLCDRLISLFARDASGKRAVFGDREKLQSDPHFCDYILFHEYFHGDTGKGLGASHQTGWTGMIAKVIQPRWPSAKDELMQANPKADKSEAQQASTEPTAGPGK